MTANVIDFPIIARPIQRVFVHHMVTRKVDFENVVDRKVCELSARACVTNEQFIWGCVIQALSEFEGISAASFVRKYLEPVSGDRTDTQQAKWPT